MDEIGGREDARAIGEAARCGCTILATAHGENMEEITRKPYLGELVRDGLFERYLFLNGREGPGVLGQCFDGVGQAVTGL